MILSCVHRKWIAPRFGVRSRGVPARSRGVRASLDPGEVIRWLTKAGKRDRSERESGTGPKKRESGKREKAGQVRYWQYGQAEKSPDLADLSRFLVQPRSPRLEKARKSHLHPSCPSSSAFR